eukprot:snap_masked-scaffold_85-processed-gene-0.4-mRNA-1 protein AED:1.00 eAED:1.00 QI:0/0/0/0/1/1/5/0/335
MSRPCVVDHYEIITDGLKNYSYFSFYFTNIVIFVSVFLWYLKREETLLKYRNFYLVGLISFSSWCFISVESFYKAKYQDIEESNFTKYEILYSCEIQTFVIQVMIGLITIAQGLRIYFWFKNAEYHKILSKQYEADFQHIDDSNQTDKTKELRKFKKKYLQPRAKAKISLLLISLIVLLLEINNKKLSRSLLSYERNYRKELFGESSLENILSNKEASSVFKKYLVYEFCVENALFLEAVKEYKIFYEQNIENSKLIQKAAKTVFKVWIGKEAKNKINISGFMSDKIKNNLEKEYLSETIFDEAYIDIFNILKFGPYIRFLESKEYQELVGIELL